MRDSASTPTGSVCGWIAPLRLTNVAATWWAKSPPARSRSMRSRERTSPTATRPPTGTKRRVRLKRSKRRAKKRAGRSSAASSTGSVGGTKPHDEAELGIDGAGRDWYHLVASSARKLALYRRQQAPSVGLIRQPPPCRGEDPNRAFYRCRISC